MTDGPGVVATLERTQCSNLSTYLPPAPEQESSEFLLLDARQAFLGAVCTQPSLRAISLLMSPRSSGALRRKSPFLVHSDQGS